MNWPTALSICLLTLSGQAAAQAREPLTLSCEDRSGPYSPVSLAVRIAYDEKSELVLQGPNADQRDAAGSVVLPNLFQDSLNVRPTNPTVFTGSISINGCSSVICDQRFKADRPLKLLVWDPERTFGFVVGLVLTERYASVLRVDTFDARKRERVAKGSPMPFSFYDGEYGISLAGT